MSALRRRTLLLGAASAGAALWVGAPALQRLAPQRFAFRPLADPPGFRRLDEGSLSGGFDPLASISAPRPGAAISAEALLADLCGALFGGAPPAGVAPVAAFSDYACPFCRVVTERLEAIEQSGAAAVRWHEWPLLGERSELSARAALAAGLQGAYPAFHAALMGAGFLPTPGYLRTLAERLGLDAERLIADMGGDQVTRALAEARGLAALFGFIGTPTLVVGRTVVQGAIGDARLRALVALEREEGPPPACA